MDQDQQRQDKRRTIEAVEKARANIDRFLQVHAVDPAIWFLVADDDVSEPAREFAEQLDQAIERREKRPPLKKQ